MKKRCILAALCCLSVSLFAEPSATKTGGESPAARADGKPDPAELGYATGLYLGSQFESIELEMDYEAVVRGLRDAYARKGSISTSEASLVVSKALEVASDRAAVKNAAEESAFFERNAKKAGVVTTASGLQYEVIHRGSGRKPLVSNTVSLHYTEALLDGRLTIDTRAEGSPLVTPVDFLVEGFAEAVQLMEPLSIYRFYVPARLAHGSTGSGAAVPPGAALVLVVELLSVE